MGPTLGLGMPPYDAAMKIHASAQTDVGRKREHNEDAFFTDADLGVHAVCDGLGGLSAGEVASRLACDTLRKFFRDHRAALESCRRTTNVFERSEIMALVKDAVQAAHLAVRHAGSADDSCAGMCCTLVMLLTMGRHVVVAHAGDSRAYLFRRNKVYPLTNDHTIAVEKVNAGLVPMQEMQHAKGGLMTRCLGCPLPRIEPDVLVLEAMEDDRYLLCSDGVTIHLTQEMLAAVAAQSTAAAMPADLVKYCNQLGGKDNITAVVVALSGFPPGHDNELAERFRLFRRMPIFCRLGIIELTRILNRGHLAAYPTGAPIITDGADDHRLFVCLSGRAEVRKNGHKLGVIRPGESCGEMAMLENAPRSADVVAVAPTALFILPREEFVATMTREPWLAIKMLFPLTQHLNHRLRRLNEKQAQDAGAAEARNAAVPAVDFFTPMEREVPAVGDTAMEELCEALPQGLAGR